MVPQQKPSKLLMTLASSMPNKDFIEALKEDSYPALDVLPKKSRSNIVAIFEVVQNKHRERVGPINYNEMAKRLDKRLRALEQHVTDHRGDGDYEQGEMMGSIAGFILEWLSKMWTAGVEDNAEPNAIHRGLQLCHTTTAKLFNPSSRADFEQLQGADFSICDRYGNNVFEREFPTLYETIAWVWREILLVTLAKDERKAKVIIIADIVRLGFSKDVEHKLRKNDELEGKDGHPFCDEHWSAEMRETAPRLMQLFCKDDIAQEI